MCQNGTSNQATATSFHISPSYSQVIFQFDAAYRQTLDAPLRKPRRYIYILYTHIHSYLLTPWSRVLLEKLTGSAVSQEIPRIFGTRRFLTVLTSARHLSLSWANSIQSPQPPPTSWISDIILSSHLRLGLHNGLFPSDFPTRTLCTPLPSPIRELVGLYILYIWQLCDAGSCGEYLELRGKK